MALTVHVNCDTLDQPLETSGVDWVEMNLTNDKLIFSAGSDVVKDGEPIPNTNQLTSAGIRITSSPVEVPHFFLADFSDNLLKEIHNAGAHNKQYVFCFSFDAATASEPVLEIWDDDSMNSFDDYCLGAGIATESFFRGIRTTDSAPGSDDWSGSRLAGSANGHFLWLNTGTGTGALTAAKNLYANLRITVPADFSSAAAEAPVIVIKYTTN